MRLFGVREKGLVFVGRRLRGPGRRVDGARRADLRRPRRRTACSWRRRRRWRRRRASPAARARGSSRPATRVAHDVLDDALVAGVERRPAELDRASCPLDDRLAIVDAERADEQIGARILGDRRDLVDPVELVEPGEAGAVLRRGGSASPSPPDICLFRGGETSRPTGRRPSNRRRRRCAAAPDLRPTIRQAPRLRRRRTRRKRRNASKPRTPTSTSLRRLWLAFGSTRRGGSGRRRRCVVLLFLMLFRGRPFLGAHGDHFMVARGNLDDRYPRNGRRLLP